MPEVQTCTIVDDDDVARDTNWSNLKSMLINVSRSRTNLVHKYLYDAHQEMKKTVAQQIEQGLIKEIDSGARVKKKAGGGFHLVIDY